MHKLYSNILCKNVVEIFQIFEMGYIQTCTSLECSRMWHPDRGHRNKFSPSECKWNNARLKNLISVPLFSMVSTHSSPYLKETSFTEFFFYLLICCFDSLYSNDNTPSNALVYDRNNTSFQSKCCLVLSLVF